MAQALRLGIFVAFLALSAIAFFRLSPPWAWLAPLALAVLGGVAAEKVFRLIATPEEMRRDLEDRTRNPPA